MVVTVLNVAEKPSVARSLAEILSGRSSRMSPMTQYTRLFEFNYMIGAQPCSMLMTSVVGHLMELDFEEPYRKWHSCDPTFLFEAPVHKYVPKDKLPIQKSLENLARRSQWLLLWLDCDREGENIAFEVVDVCKRANMHLRVFRARFSALIERDIHHAIQHLEPPNQLFSDAVDARQEIDLRIGASFTRFQTMLLRDRYALPYQDEKLVLSYGPCQFPTLGFVVERYWEVQAHQPEDFWTIKCCYRSGNDGATFNWTRGRLFDYLAAAVIYEMCVEQPTATVYSVTGRENRKWPPYPLNTVELQKRASRFLRLSSEHTMKIAEELYQQGFISYPRTETDFFPENMDLRQMVHEQTRHSVWGNYAHRLLDPQDNLWKPPGNGGHNDKAHPPIHPSRFSEGEGNWSPGHKAVYEFVVRHFLACVSQPAMGYGTTALIDIAGEQFSASGLMVTARNYLDVYRYERWGESTLPNFEVGQQFLPTQLVLDTGRTQPPSLLTEAELIAMMDQAGIGTDATMHDHIKKLLDRHYVVKDQNMRFQPTNLGEALVMGYQSMGYEGIWKPVIRSVMESDMKAVSEGTKVKAEVLRRSLNDMKNCLVDAKARKQMLLESMALFFERNQTQRDEGEIGGIIRRCPDCREADMVLKKKQDGKFMVGCLNYPQCRSAVWLPGALMEATVTAEVCTSCLPGPVFKISMRFRRAEIPPQFDALRTACVGGCDAELREIIDMCGAGRGQAPPRPSAPAGRQAPGFGNNAFGQQAPPFPGFGHPRPTHQAPPFSGEGNGNAAINRQPNASSTPQCACPAACVLRTANTAANRGRKFYACRTRACGHFVWEDDVQNSSAAPQRGRPRNQTRSRGSRGDRGGRGMIALATGETFYDARPDF